MFTGATAVIQARSHPVLQSNREQLEMHFAVTIVAVHVAWVTACLHEVQIFTGVSVETQGCFQDIWRSGIDSRLSFLPWKFAAVPHVWAIAHMCALQIFIGVSRVWVFRKYLICKYLICV